MLKKIIYLIIYYIYILSFSQIVTLGSYLGGKQYSRIGSLISKNVLNDLLPYLYQNGFDSTIYYSGNYDKTDKIDIMIGNHLNMIDFTIYTSIIKQFDNRDIYLVVKKEIIFIPGAGFIVGTAPDIKMNRKYEDDKDNIINTIKKIKNGIIIIMPEGSRYTTEKKNLAQKYSNDNNLHIFNNMLYPKMKGLWLILKCLHESNKLGNIIDLTVVIENYKKKELSTTDVFKTKLGDTFVIISSYDNHYYMPGINDYDIFKSWFIEKWKIKDNILDKIFTKDDNYIYKKLNISLPTSSYILLLIISSLFIYLMVKSNGLFLPLSLVITYIITYIRYKMI